MITAKDLLYKALAYDGIWSSSKIMRDSEPSKARKQQLDSLLHTFQISKKNAKNLSHVPSRISNSSEVVKKFYVTSKSRKPLERIDYIKTLSDFRYFTSGEFITDNDRAKYDDTLERIVSVVKKSFPLEAKNIDAQSIDLTRLFHKLYLFRHSAYITFETSFRKLSRSQDFIMEEAFCDLMEEEFIGKIPGNFTELDEVLCTLIDPEKRSFTEAEVKYPEFDLDVLDLDWQESLHR